MVLVGPQPQSQAQQSQIFLLLGMLGPDIGCSMPVECVVPHVLREEGHDGGYVGDQAKQAQTREKNPFTPELILLPHLVNR